MTKEQKDLIKFLDEQIEIDESDGMTLTAGKHRKVKKLLEELIREKSLSIFKDCIGDE